MAELEVLTVDVTPQLVHTKIVPLVEQALGLGAVELAADVKADDVITAAERILLDDTPPQFQKWPVNGPKIPAGPAQARFIDSLIVAAARGIGKQVAVAPKDAAPTDGHWEGQLDAPPGKFPQIT
jgi:hypothetical protein